ncbi:MAG: alpha/beta fold hydrolase [Cyanobacteria bacterium SZAS TMP-1]|nr:alpha/beta fold hydrolase [Cyanobacteria bacterium SZAS TMP-1]
MDTPIFKRTGLNPDSRVGALLLHGLTGIPKEMRPIAKRLEAAGVVVSTPLLPGHGDSYKQMLGTTWQDWVEGAQKEFDELAKECDRIVVAGLSMGAILSIIIASRNKKAAGIGLLSATMKYDGNGASKYAPLLPLVDIFPFLGSWCYWTEQPPYGLKDERLQKMITRQLEKASKGESSDYGLFRTYAYSLRQLDRMVKYCRTAAPHVKCPALVLHSLEDSLTSEANAIEVYRMLGSRDKRMVLLSGCDHVLTLDLRKEDVANHILQLTIDASYYDTTGRAQVENYPSPVAV